MKRVFAKSDQDGRRAAFMFTPIHTATLNHVDPQSVHRDVLACIADKQ